MWLSDDGGETWRHGNAGLVPRYVPEESQGDTIDLCVHNMHRTPQRPERLFMQFHGGVYRSDDTGETWTSIAEGLPSDFGFPMVIDPGDPDTAFVIPLVADTDRVTVDGRVRVFGTRDAGESWTSLSDGLPQDGAYLTILRQAFGHEGEGPGWASTSEPRRETCSGPGMRGPLGSRSESGWRRSTRSGWPRPARSPRHVRGCLHHGAMGEIVSLAEYRDRRSPELAVMRRLEHAVGRLDSVVQRRPGRMAPTVERELLLIARAVSSGMPLAAADRAERLADLLEHPAASGS